MGNGCWSWGSFLTAVTVATFDFSSTVIVHWSFDDVAPRSRKPDFTRALKQHEKTPNLKISEKHIKTNAYDVRSNKKMIAEEIKARRRRAARGCFFLEIGNRDSSFVVDTNRVFSSSFFQKEKIGTAWLTSVKIAASMYQNRDKKGLNIDPERVGLVCYAYAQRFALVFLGENFEIFLRKVVKVERLRSRWWGNNFHKNEMKKYNHLWIKKCII